MTTALLIEGARLLDPQGELHRPEMEALLVRDGRIAARGADAVAQAEGAARLDASGLLLTPGFINAHSHSHDVLLRGLFEGLPLEVWGLLAFPTAWPHRSEQEVHLRALLHGAECLRGGITTVQDMVTIVGQDRAHAEAVIAAYARIGIRAVMAMQIADRAGVDSLPFTESFADLLPKAADPTPMLRFAEDMLALSGPRLSWGLGPSAPQRCSDTMLTWVAATARARGLPVFTHVYETRSQAVHARLAQPQDGGSVTTLARAGLLGPSLVVAHGVWTAPEEITRLGDAGAHLANNPAANFKLLNGVAPVRAYAKAGVGLALGCDNSSAGDAQNMFAAMRAFALAWSLQSDAGETEAAARAFRAATLGGAAAVGLAGEVGSLAVGARADLVLFDLAEPAWWPLNSAVRQLVYAESGASIRHVLVDGEPVVRDGRLVHVTETALANQAEAARAAMAADLAGLQQRTAPLRDALLRMHEQVRATALPFDRLRLG
jgi:5-methylthioadenosine/S-adenosylhomocysteine deaminase